MTSRAVPRETGGVRRTGTLLFVLPALVLSLGITFIPGLLTVAASLTYWDGVSRPVWIGMENYRSLLHDIGFWHALFNNIRWTILFLTVPTAAALLVATLLRPRRRIMGVYQAVLLLPYIVSPIANASVWTNIIFDPVGGVVGWFSRTVWPVANPLGVPSTALYAVACIDMWHFWGYLTVVFLAALRQVPSDQLDAAMIEGASTWQVFRHVTFPAIRPTIAVMLVMETIFSFLTFDYVYLTTQGGPGYATEVLATRAYDLAFHLLEVGKAAAVAMVMSLFGLLAAFVYVRFSREMAR
ncbi:carbohydrate ABC transporter permease [Acidomonas methanolica]|uniref:carbohydrate ABC transporter permease n=1 Tax=Acidomonas methanolica TaxID=437 RepID=UPI002119CA4B|nr:sugar ABC transporter permease [Acidomonas methanolica]